MPNCPFCQATITEELDRFGGSCPHCFNEVPGEEAATDPGIEEPAPGAAAADEKKGGGLGPVLGIVLLLLGGGAFWALGPGATKAPVPTAVGSDDDIGFYSIDLDELETTSLIPSVAGREQAEKAAGSPSGGGSRPQASPTTTGSRSTTGTTSPPSTTAEAVVPSEPAPASTTETSKPQTTAEKSSGASVGGGVSPRRRSSGGVALSEPAEIAAMVRDAMSRYSEQFVQCHTKKLNQDEGFGGTWELSLVVNTDGSASRIGIVAKDGTPPDAEFEGCMKSKVERWRFKTTTEAMGFKKRYTFGG